MAECVESNYQIEVYDRYDRVGGLLVYGLPNFKLEKTVVARRHDLLTAGGIRFHLDTEIGRDLSFAELQARHDAVLIASGVYRARDLVRVGEVAGHDALARTDGAAGARHLDDAGAGVG